MLRLMNPALCLLMVLNRCALFHAYVKCPMALEADAKFICNVKQFKIETNTKTVDDNEDGCHPVSQRR